MWLFFIIALFFAQSTYAGLRDRDRESMYDRNLNQAEDHYIIQKQRSLAQHNYCETFPYYPGCYSSEKENSFREIEDDWE